MEPIPNLPGSVLASRMPATAARDFVEWGPAPNAAAQFDRVLTREVPVQELIAGSPHIPALSDDEPINEYFLLRSLMNAPR